MISSHLLFFFAALGAFNGLALTLFLLFRRPTTPAQRWLASLICAVSIRTGKSVFFYFYPHVSKQLLQAGLIACFLIGPCLVGFVRVWGDPSGERTRADWKVAAGLLAAALLVGTVFTYADRPGAWIHGVTWSWLACLTLAGAIHHRNAAKGRTEAAEDGITRGHVWAIIAGVWVIWLAYFTSGLTSYIVGALSFSLVLYLGIIAMLARRNARRANVLPYQNRRIAAEEAEAPLLALHRLMAEEALYKDPTLNLDRVARRLNTPPARLSQLLNDNLKTAFKPYLTGFRINAAKELLRAPERLTMEAIAEASGFLSMSTFYDSFRKTEGMTPAAWRRSRMQAADDSGNTFQERECPENAG